MNILIDIVHWVRNTIVDIVNRIDNAFERLFRSFFFLLTNHRDILFMLTFYVVVVVVKVQTLKMQFIPLCRSFLC